MVKSGLLSKVLSTLLIVLSFSSSLNAQDLNAKLPVDPNLSTGKLSNGLTYYIRHNRKPENKVELRLVVKAGSILEDDDQQGLAHFMEHMNFNGTKNFQKNELVNYLQSIGVEFGADLNAYTAFDQTVYILPIPTDKPGNLEKGFQIIEDWAHNSLLTDKDIDEERNVVLEESRLGKGANMRMLDKYFPKLASGSLYAKRLPIGKDSILKSFKYETIRRYYKDWYRPDLQAVAIVGDISIDSAKKMLIAHFGNLTNPAHEKPRKYLDVMPRTSPDAMIVTDKEATNSLVQILYPYTKKKPEVTIGDYASQMKRNLALQMINQRLSDLAQSSTPPFIYAQAGFDDLIHGYECFAVTALFGNDGPENAINAATAELLKIKKYGFTQSELDRARKDMMSGMEKIYNERNTTDSKGYVDEYIRNFLENEPFPGIENEYKYYQAILPVVKVEELNSLLPSWINNTNTFTLVTAPDKPGVKLPSERELLAMTAKAYTQDVKQEAEKTVQSTLITNLLISGKIVSKKEEKDFNATTYTLSNGIKVTIKATDFKSDEILLKGLKKGGSGNYNTPDRSNVHFATDIVDAMGIGNFSPVELEKALAGKNANVDVSIGDIENSVAGNCSVKDFETMMQLLYLSLTSPRKDEGLYKALISKQQTMVQFMSSNPQAAFADTIVKTLYHNNPLARIVIPTSKDFASINLDRVLEIYKNEFSTADGYQFFIVGNINTETALPFIEKYLGSLPASGQQTQYRDNGVRPMEGVNKLTFHKGTEKKSMIIANYYGTIPYSEDLALKAQALAEILNIKVIEVLREKMGGIYTGGFRSSVAKEPYERYSLSLQLPCGPDNVDKLLTATNDEIKNIKEKGPDEKDLNKVKTEWIEKNKIGIKENKYWADIMTSVLFWERDRKHVLDYETWVNSLTPKEVQETARLLFNGKNEFTAILYPEQ